MLGMMHHWTAVDALMAGTVACLGMIVLGGVAHAVLKDNGLGTVVNGLLLLAGMLMGAFARSLTIGFQ